MNISKQSLLFHVIWIVMAFKKVPFGCSRCCIAHVCLWNEIRYGSKISYDILVDRDYWANKVRFVWSLKLLCIMMTRLYNFSPLKPHFYIVKMGLPRYTLCFLFMLKNIDVGTHNLWFEQKYEKYQSFFFLSENFHFFFLVKQFSVYLNKRVFVKGEKLRQTS